MATAPPSDAALVRYLLGKADRQDEERFDELSVTDAEFAARLRAIEHDLADAYVRGELSRFDRTRWEARYLASQHGRDDLAVANVLAAREHAGTEDAAYDEAPGASRPVGRANLPVGRVFRPGTWFVPRTWWPVAAAAVLVLAVIVGYRMTRGEHPRATVAHQAPVMTPAPTPAERTPPATIVALTLAPSVRSIGEPPTLTIPRSVTGVKLTLRLEADARDRCFVALRELATNTIAWRSDAQAPSGDDADRTLVVSIPASTFHNGRYLINVSAGASNREIIATYPLAVVLQ